MAPPGAPQRKSFVAKRNAWTFSKGLRARSKREERPMVVLALNGDHAPYGSGQMAFVGVADEQFTRDLEQALVSFTLRTGKKKEST